MQVAGLRAADATRGCPLAAALRCCSPCAALSVAGRLVAALAEGSAPSRSLSLCWRSLVLSLRDSPGTAEFCGFPKPAGLMLEGSVSLSRAKRNVWRWLFS